MKTKVAAARIAVSQGIPMVLANGCRGGDLSFLNKNGNAADVLPHGTLFLPKQSFLGNRKGWLAFSTRPAGRIIVDDGASKAIIEKGKSLLPSGILATEGSFCRGEIVEIMHDSEIIARGIVNYGSGDIDKIKGKHSSEAEKILGLGHEQEVVHRNNLSLWK